MGEPIDIYAEKDAPSQGRHARVTVPRHIRSCDEARLNAGASRVAHNGVFIRGGGAAIGGSSWFARRRLLAIEAAALAVVVLVGVLTTYGHVVANGGGDQGAAQEAL